MTTIVTALNRAAIQTGVKSPSSWITATRDDHAEMRDIFLNETADDILDRVDLPSPIGAQYALTGDGSETYDLPAAFKRLHRTRLAVYDSLLDRPCVPVHTDGEYTYLKDQGSAGTVKYYKVTGYEGNYDISIYPSPTSSDTITISYSTTYWKATAGGTVGDTFSADDDILLLPWRLVTAGIVWRSRERAGLPYEDKFNEYELLMTRLMNDARGYRSVNMGEPDAVRWQDLIPAFIPSS